MKKICAVLDIQGCKHKRWLYVDFDSEWSWTDQNHLWHVAAKRYIRHPLLYVLRPKTQRTRTQKESHEDTHIVLPSVISHMIQRHVWCNTAEQTPPASGRPPLTTDVETENKNPTLRSEALPRNARQKRLSPSVKGADWKGYSDLGAARLALGGGCPRWGIPTTDPGRRITKRATNIMAFVPHRHPQDAASLWSAAGLLGQISNPWLLYWGLGSNLYCNIVGGREQELILTEGNPVPVGNKLLLS